MQRNDFILFGVAMALTIIISVAVSTFIISGSLSSINRNIGSLNGTINNVNKTVQANSDANFVNLQAKISQSVVVLLTYPTQVSGGASAIFVDSQGIAWNRGTAFSIDANGDLFTAYHVIANETKGKILFTNGTNMTFSINKTNEIAIPTQDVAILYVHTHLPPVSLSTLGLPRGAGIGSSIAFVGFPTVTVINGNVIPVRTVVKGTIAGITAFPYTSTALINETLVYYLGGPVNSGNSGGPLFSATTGNVIGIINAKFNNIQDIGVATAINQSMINYMLNGGHS